MFVLSHVPILRYASELRMGHPAVRVLRGYSGGEEVGDRDVSTFPGPQLRGTGGTRRCYWSGVTPFFRITLPYLRSSPVMTMAKAWRARS